MIEYENITNRKKGKDDAIKEAFDIINNGWSRRNYPRIDINQNIPWQLVNQNERSWNFYIHSWDMIDPLLYAYNKEKNDNLFKPALKIILDWIDNYVDIKLGVPIIDGSSDDLAWYDMAVGMRAYRLAYVFDNYRNFSHNDKQTCQKLWQGLLAHQNYLEDDSNIVFHNNHGYYQAAGQIAMGRRFSSESEDMVVALNQGLERFNTMLTQQFTAEGVHREHSPDYHRMVYETLLGMIKSDLISDDFIISFTRKIEESLSWFILPDTHICNFGDSDYRLLQTSVKAAQRKWQTPEMQYVTTGGQIGALPDDTLKVFEEAGYYIVRNNNSDDTNDFSKCSYLAQTAAFHSRTHKHADDLSFIWYERGNNILIDAGRFGYIGKSKIGSDLWLQGNWYTHPSRVYCEATRSHNTLEFNNKDYLRKGFKPYGSAIQRSNQYNNGLTVLETECKHFKSIRRVRVLIYMPDKWLIVYDWFKDNVEDFHDVKQWFNFGEQVEIRKKDQNFELFLKDNNNLYILPLLNHVKASEVVRGVESPKLQGWYSPSEKELLPVPSINYSLDNLNSGAIATLFNFDNQPTTEVRSNLVNSSGRDLRIRWKDINGVHSLYLNRKKEGAIEVEYEVSD